MGELLILAAFVGALAGGAWLLESPTARTLYGTVRMGATGAHCRMVDWACDLDHARKDGDQWTSERGLW